MEKTTATTTIYKFEDMNVYVIDNGTEFDCYIENEAESANLIFTFGGFSKDLNEVGIEALYENGYLHQWFNDTEAENE